MLRGYVNISDVLILSLSSKQIGLHVSPESFGVNIWIRRMMRHWIPDFWSRNGKCTSPKGAQANSRNWQLMSSGRSQMLATRNVGD